MSDHNILTLLDVSDINNNVIVNITLLMLLLLWLLVTLVILLVMTMGTIMIGMTKVVTAWVCCTICESNKRGREKKYKGLHFK